MLLSINFYEKYNENIKNNEASTTQNDNSSFYEEESDAYIPLSLVKKS